MEILNICFPIEYLSLNIALSLPGQQLESSPVQAARFQVLISPSFSVYHQVVSAIVMPEVGTHEGLELITVYLLHLK